MPMPDGFEISSLRPPKLRPRNLPPGPGPGRPAGGINRITKDLKSGVLNGAIAHGYDGEGLGGLEGYLQMCATKYPKHYMHLLGKLLPLQVNTDAPTGTHINSVNIISIPSDRYLAPEDIEKMRAPGLLDHAPIEQFEPVHFDDPARPETEAPQSIAPAPPSENDLIMQQARALGYVPLPPRSR